MTSAADVIFVEGEVHTLTEPDRTAEAVAVRDGTIVQIGNTFDVEFLAGIDTRRIDLDGRVLLPGFIDSHTHMTHLGQSLVHADLSEVRSRENLLETLERDHDPNHEWILGFGYDESEWDEDGDFLTRADLDSVSTDRPVAVFRIDMHSASLNSIALERLAEELPRDRVHTRDGEPTGVVVEEAVDVLRTAVDPGREGTRRLIEAAVGYANERGVTGVHDMVRDSEAPAVYRELAMEGALSLRVTLNYWADHLDAVAELGLRPGCGGEFVRTGAIKTFTDGSLGSRTARLSEPYADDPSETGEWVLEPDELEEVVERADAEAQQLAIHAIGDEAIGETVEALESRSPDTARHRIEHVEVLPDDLLDRVADSGAIASVQPNFLKWAGEGGLYDRRLGRDRREQSNRFGAMGEAGIPLAFGSDCMPMDPLFGIHHAVNAPEPDQRLGVTEAIRAYTLGSAYAAFDENRVGTIEAGKRADFVVLESAPWEQPERISDIEVAMTVVDGKIVYERNVD